MQDIRFARDAGLTNVGTVGKVVSLAAGSAGSDPIQWPELLTTLGPAVNAPADFKVGPKVTAFWNEIITRDGFKKVYADGLH